MIWEEFEVKCVEYLRNKFGDYATFTRIGGEDSTRSDIDVKCNNGRLFSIETKHCPAQCGQFVLLPDIENELFVYSKLNTTPINDSARSIMEYMNIDFSSFKDAGSAGKTIDYTDCNNVFAAWIIDHYKHMNVKYFMTNNYEIVPIDMFLEYFNVSAKYRIKRSGSTYVAKSKMLNVIEYIASLGLAVYDTNIEGKKLFVKCTDDIDNRKFIIDNNEYMFAKRDDRYEVRKLSNTYNANVIFSITFTGKHGLSDDDFIKALTE